ncbi:MULTISPECIES: MFS transporter [unclassified Sphingomonas]|uniref:MFS transporter n=1 Tax=unclassified Sphingomonas TaxID=196159 RepID=UPI00226AD2F5|nr:MULTISPECIES: MFS transporter [unclassified Sphingomonas]
MSTAQPRTFARALPPLLVLALAMALGFTTMGSFSMVQEGAKLEMGLTDKALGLIQGLSAAIPLALFSIPIGILVDRGRRVRLLAVMASIWTLGTVVTAFAPSATILFIGRMLTGIGTTGGLTAALSLGADLCAPAHRGRALLIVTLGKTLGVALAFGLSGALLGWFLHGAVLPYLPPLGPWRSVHVALAVLSVVACLPILMMQEPARQEVTAGVHAPFRIVAAELWARRRFLVPLFVGQVSVVMADAAAGIWAAPILQRNYHLTPDQFAGWMGMLIFITGLVGTIVGGFTADVGHNSGRRGGVLFSSFAAALIGIPTALFAIAPNVPLFAVALGALVLCGTITGLGTSVALTVLIPNELRGLCIGAFIAVAGVIGYGVAPSLVTLTSDALGGETHLGAGQAIVGVIVSLIAAAMFLVAIRRAPFGPEIEPL